MWGLIDVTNRVIFLYILCRSYDFLSATRLERKYRASYAIFLDRLKSILRWRIRLLGILFNCWCNSHDGRHENFRGTRLFFRRISQGCTSAVPFIYFLFPSFFFSVILLIKILLGIFLAYRYLEKKKRGIWLGISDDISYNLFYVLCN